MFIAPSIHFSSQFSFTVLKPHCIPHNCKRQSFVYAPFSSISLSPSFALTSLPMANSADSPLKSDALLEQMKQYLTTDAGKEILKKVGHVYQINISPKVSLSLSCNFSNLQVCWKFLIRSELLSENWNWWGGLYHWSQERGSYQRLGFLFSWIRRFFSRETSIYSTRYTDFWMLLLRLLSILFLIVQIYSPHPMLLDYGERWIYLLSLMPCARTSLYLTTVIITPDEFRVFRSLF